MGFLEEISKLPDHLAQGLGGALGVLSAIQSARSGQLPNYLAARAQALDDPAVRNTLSPFGAGALFVGGSQVPQWNTSGANLGPNTVEVPSYGGTRFVANTPDYSPEEQLKQANQRSLLTQREYANEVAHAQSGILNQVTGQQPYIPNTGIIPTSGGGGKPVAMMNGQPVMAGGGAPAPVPAYGGMPVAQTQNPPAIQATPASGSAPAPSSAPPGVGSLNWPPGVTSINAHGITLQPPAFVKTKAGTKNSAGKVVKTGDVFDPANPNQRALVEPAADTGQVEAQIKRLEGAMAGYKYLYVDPITDKSGRQVGYARDILPKPGVLGFAEAKIPGVVPFERAAQRFQGDPRAQAFETGNAQAVDFARAVGGAARMNQEEIKRLQRAFVPQGNESQAEFDNKVNQTIGFMAKLAEGLRAHKDEIEAVDKQLGPDRLDENPVVKELKQEAYNSAGITPPPPGPGNPDALTGAAQTPATPLPAPQGEPQQTDSINLGGGFSIKMKPK